MLEARWLGTVLCLIAAVGAPAAHALPEEYTAALLPVMAKDLLEPQKRAIDDRIREIAANNALKVQPAAETVRNIDKAKRAGAACNIESLACQAQMGVLLGTKQVIVARVASDWAGDRLELRLLDALRGSTIREATHVLPKETKLRRRVIDGIIFSVLVPPKTGSVAITSGKGDLFLDGVPLKADGDTAHADGLAPGAHDVELRVEGQPPKRASFVTVSGETAEVAVGAPLPVTPPPATDGASGVGLWLVGGGGALAVAAVIGAGSLEAALELSPMERSTRDTVQATGLGLLGATAVGVVVAGAGGAMMALEPSP